MIKSPAYDQNNNGSSSKISFNRIITGDIFHLNSSKLSPSRKRLSHGNFKKSHGSCREKIVPPQSNEKLQRKGSMPLTKEGGIFQKRKETVKTSISPPLVKLSDLSVKAVIPEESEEDLQAELEMDKKTQDLFKEKEISNISRRKTVGRSKKIIYSAPAGVYWPDLSTLVEIEEKMDPKSSDQDWFGSGDHILIKNFTNNDSLLYENSENNYDLPSDEVAASRKNYNNLTEEPEDFYENSMIYANQTSQESSPEMSCTTANSSNLSVPSEPIPKKSISNVGSAFTRVIPENSINRKFKEYFDIRQEHPESRPRNDQNNNQERDEYYDEAWDQRLERKLGYENTESILQKKIQSETITAEKFQPVEEPTYEPPWDSVENKSAAILNKFSPITLITKEIQQSGQPRSANANPLESEIWYHANMTRSSAEAALLKELDGTYLVRPSETSANDFSLSIKSSSSLNSRFRGVLHMKISRERGTNRFILGEYSKPYESIQKMIDHFTHCMVPVKDAESVRLQYPLAKKTTSSV